MTAIHMLKIIIMPRCTGWMPYWTAMGRKIGVKISTAGVASSGMPMTSRITIMIARKTTGESVNSVSQLPIRSGMPEKVMAKLMIDDRPIRKITTELVRVADSRIRGRSLMPMVR